MQNPPISTNGTHVQKEDLPAILKKLEDTPMKIRAQNHSQFDNSVKLAILIN